MKKIFLFLLILGFNTHSQIINIPDANFKNALINDYQLDVNMDGEIDQTEALDLVQAYLPNLNISSLQGIQYFTNLWELDVSDNALTELDVSMLPNLTILSCNNNSITTLLFTNNLEVLRCAHNQITNLNIVGLNNLVCLDIAYNQLTSIVFPTCSFIDYYLDISGNIYTEVDLSPIQNTQFSDFTCVNSNLQSLHMVSQFYTTTIQNNLQLTFLNLKNGFTDYCYSNDPLNPCPSDYFVVTENSNIQTVCVDNYENNYFQSYFGNNVAITNYCSFTPAGNYNTIVGNVSLNCSGATLPLANQELTITDALNSDMTFSNPTGNYWAYTGYGNYTVILSGVNSNYFTVSPSNYTFNFTTSNTTETANFCVSPNGVHPDLVVTIVPITSARPGFDATYLITFKNQGTQTQSGMVSLTYQDDVFDLVTATPEPNTNTTNLLSWNFVDLQPFETRTITLTLNVNSPMETPPVNIGDILPFTATITSPQADETPADNTMSFEQTVVGSFDPNDKAVVEGEQISISQIGEYLHYIIRFQNMGTAPAENVVVKDMLNDKLDLTTLQMVSSSHPYRSTLTAGNKLEFFYEGINLPPAITDEPGSHGYIAFKIKPKSTVVVNDVITNNANIYFDYNFPIETNTVSTTVTALKNTSFESSSFSLYPNPTKGVLNILLMQNETIKTATIYNLIGQKLMMSTNSSSLDVSTLPKGSYLLTLETTGGIATKRFVKM